MATKTKETPGMQAIAGFVSLLTQIENQKIAAPFEISLEHGDEGERLILSFGKDIAEVKVNKDQDPVNTYATVKLVLRSTDPWKIKVVGRDANKKPIFLRGEFDA
jgi:hypothetical protein